MYKFYLDFRFILYLNFVQSSFPIALGVICSLYSFESVGYFCQFFIESVLKETKL